MSVSSDEVNYLVYRYLQESGFLHSAFTFAHESLVARSVVADAEVPPGALLSFLQKGLQYVEVEVHLQEDGTERQCDEPFHLLTPHVCRVKAAASAKGSAGASSSSSSSSSAPADALMAGPPPPGTEVPPSDVAVLAGHAAEVFGVAWSPRGDVLATGAGDGTARVWRLGEPGAPSTTLRHSSADGAAGSGAGAGSSSSGAAAAAAAGGKPKKERSDVAALEWSPDGARLATGCSDNRARIWNADGSLAGTLSQHTAGVSAVHWSPSGNTLLTSSYDKTVVVWDPTTSEARQQFSFHSAPVLTCAWGTDTTFASAGTDKAVHVCALGERAPSRTFAGHVDEVNSVAWSPNASRGILASGSDDGTVRVWSMASPSGADACLATLVGSARDAGSGSPSASASAAARRSVYQVAWSPTGEGTRNASKQAQIASACFDGTVKVWDVGTLKARGTPALFTLQRHAALVYALAYSPDGDYLATAGADRSVNIYSAADGSLVRTYLGPAAAFDAAFSPAGNRLAVAFASGVTTVIDLRR